MPQCDNEVWECECSFSLKKQKNRVKKTKPKKPNQKNQTKPSPTKPKNNRRIKTKPNETLSIVTFFPMSCANMSS